MSEEFYELHQRGTFLLVNVHDVGAAILAEAAGANALGTTSAGHAYSLGREDGVGALSRGEVAEQVAAICAAVDIPLSVDAENGWGHSPEEVAETIRILASAGAAGASIEDWSSDDDIGFYDRGLALERITAAVETAASLPAPFVICARAEAFLYDAPNPMEEVLARLQSFAAAGADCLYAPGPRDLETLRRIANEAGGPINALIGMGSGFTMADAAEIGIRRVSVGASLYRATMSRFDSLVRQLVSTGSFSIDENPLAD